MTTETTEDPLLIAWRQARAEAKRFYDSAMADADKIHNQWLAQQQARAVRGAALSTATWQDRLAALQALGDTSLRMRKPNDWYVMQHYVEIGGDGMLTGSYGNGASPQEAVEKHWQMCTTLPADRYLVIRRNGLRLHAHWDGDAWKTWTPDA